MKQVSTERVCVTVKKGVIRGGGHGVGLIRKNLFVKCNMSGYVNLFRGKVKTLIASMVRWVPEEHTREGASLKLVDGRRGEMRITKATKSSQMGVQGLAFVEGRCRGGIFGDFVWENVVDICSCG